MHRPAPCKTPLALSVAALFAYGACVEQSSDAPTAEEIKAARQKVVLSAAPTPKYPMLAVLKNPSGSGRITYLGMDIDPERPTLSQSFTLTHYLRVEEPFPDGWRFFVHLGDPTLADRRLHRNADHVPGDGKYPIGQWKKGEIIRDTHKVSLDATWGKDAAGVFVGFWKGGTRAAVESGPSDGQSRVRVATIGLNGAPASPTPQRRRLLARRVADAGRGAPAITIDGKLDEAAWKGAVSSGRFLNTMNGQAVEQRSEAKVLWDSANLYVAFDFDDADIWGSFSKHDDKLWTQEAAELFIDADGDGRSYVELQVSPRNTTFDSWLPAYRQNDNAWDAPMETAVNVRGTLDKRDDKDEGWTVEMRIPLEAVKGRMAEMKGVPPKVGSEWRVNLFRMDMPAGKPQNACAWSPPLIGDFHALDKFGVLVFTDEDGKDPADSKVPAAAPGGIGDPRGTAGQVLLAKPPDATESKPDDKKADDKKADDKKDGKKKAKAEKAPAAKP